MASQHTFTGTTTGLTLNTAGNFDNNVAMADDDIGLFTSIGTGSIIHHASSTALTGLTLHLKSGYTGSWGVEAVGAAVAAYVKLGGSVTNKANVLYIGGSEGGLTDNGSPLLLIENLGAGGTNVGAMHVFGYKTGSAANNYPPVSFKGPSHRGWFYGGEYGYAVRPGELATLNSLHLNKGADGSTPTVRLGLGVTLPGGSGTNGIFVEAGKLYTRSSGTAALVLVGSSEANYYVEEDCPGAHTNINIEQGKVFYDGSGNITNVTARANTTFQRRAASVLGAFTIEAYANSVIDLRNGSPGSYGTVTINCRDGPGTFSLYTDAGTTVNLR